MKKMTKNKTGKSVVPAEKTAGKTVLKTGTEKPAASSGKKRNGAKPPVEKPAVKKSVVKKPSPAKRAVVKAAASSKKTVAKKSVAKKPSPAKKAVVKTAVSSKKAVVKKPVVKKPSPAKKAVVKAAPVAEKPVPSKREEVSRSSSRPHRKLKLNKAQRAHYFNLLMRLRNDYLNQIQFHRDDALSSKKDAAGERAGMATHMADLGSDNFRHDLELELLSGEGNVIVMIDEALQRIADSEYGICSDCGGEIGFERLDAKPYARFCIKCKALREQAGDSVLRYRR